jgi:HK97 family phage major capsid protein/HK97 family phage prohead protease
MRSLEPVLEDRNTPNIEERTAVVDLENARIEGNTLHGFAAVYNTPSEPIEDRGRTWVETIAPGAFDDVLASSPDVYLSVNHDPSSALARTPDTLRLHNEDRGLRFEADLGDSPTAQDIRSAVSRNVLRGASFRFSCAPGGDAWSRGNDGTERRTLNKVARLVDISVATTPAYAGTTIELRSQRPPAPQPRPSLTVEMRSQLAGPADETRARIALRPEDRMSTWQGRRGRGTFSEENAAEFSLGRAVRGMVTGAWDDAELERRALSEGSDAAGGFAVPSPLASYTIDLIRNASQVINAGAVTVPMESETLTIPRLASDPTPEWHEENAEVKDSDPSFERVTFTAHTLPVLTRISMELFEDISSSASDRISNALIQSVSLEMDRAALRGSGTDPEPKGLRNQEGVDIRSLGTNGAKLTDWSAIVKALGAVKRRNITPSGVIWSSRTAETYALMTDTLHQPLMPPQYVREVPFYETNQIPDDLTQGTAKEEASEVYVGRWSDLLIGVRPTLGVRLRQLNERFADNLQVGLLAWIRCDVQIAHPASFSVITGVLE